MPAYCLLMGNNFLNDPHCEKKMPRFSMAKALKASNSVTSPLNTPPRLSSEVESERAHLQR
jgi:hypothetical protein